MTKPILSVLDGSTQERPPVWLMRQAGRYLPEYRAIREKAGGFLDLVFNPELAAEVTLQPVRRFGFDAAILFSDILVVPHALGQTVTFSAGEGPSARSDRRSHPLRAAEFGSRSRRPGTGLRNHPAREAELPPAVALLGFCGAPWTVATYMIAGRGTPDQAPARLFAYNDAAAFDVLMDVLTEASTDYLVRQLQAGADAVQIFDTWAGVLSPEQFARWCIAPTKRIVAGVREQMPGAKIIGFPRGAGTMLPRYVSETGVDAVGLDWMIDRTFAREHVQSAVPVQGNLDPLVLVAGGVALDRSVDAVLEAFAQGPFIFNLGHGIVPETPIAHVEQMLKRVRGLILPFRGRDSELAPMDVWLKAFHIIAVIAWMAGMLYLPRLFVYHCDAEPGSKQSETFKVMERRLLRAIINPAMIATWVLGLWLAWRAGWFTAGWLQAKLVLVLSDVGGARPVRRLCARFCPRPEPAPGEILSYYQ